MTGAIYYDPEKVGLAKVWEAELSSGSYEFSILLVVGSPASGAVYVLHDAGCSCPSPFEGYEDTFNVTAELDRVDTRTPDAIRLAISNVIDANRFHGTEADAEQTKSAGTAAVLAWLSTLDNPTTINPTDRVIRVIESPTTES